VQGENSAAVSRQLGRLATGIVIGRLDTPERVAAATAELRAIPGTGIDLEWQLQALERAASRRAAKAGGGFSENPRGF
jgi:hypothetical protein